MMQFVCYLFIYFVQAHYERMYAQLLYSFSSI